MGAAWRGEGDPAAEGSMSAHDKVTALIEARVQEISDSEGDVVLAVEAAEIINHLRQTDPRSLIDWFSAHAVALIGEQLQTRLALIRRRNRVGVFEHTVRPLQRRYAVEGHVWKRVGDMLRPDWMYLIEERVMLAKASLFDIALAKRVIARLPDDETRTADVLSDLELTQLEGQAQLAADQAVEKFAA
jgi:hypothetical protein